MKNIMLVCMAVFFCTQYHIAQNVSSIYDIQIRNLDSTQINLNVFKGKMILVVNVASKCGYTPQYKDLQELQMRFPDKLIVIGIPSNQFGQQEPGSATEIQAFCTEKYSVTFPMTEKIDVKGDNQHALYKWLTTKELNGHSDSEVKWNFQKYLVSENGDLLDVFYSKTKPFDEKIMAYLVD